MKTNLSYIDDVMDRAIEEQSNKVALSEREREEAAVKARRVIAGFKVKDEAAEKAALDDMVAKRNRAFGVFRADRKEIRDRLAEKGITPLAVCPSKAWAAICRESELYTFSPDTNGRVTYRRDAISKYRSVKAFEQACDGDRRYGVLREMFPDFIQFRGSGMGWVTLLLPDPPKEVADILCKAQGFTMKVAAVADAISFVETKDEIYRSSHDPRDLWAKQQGYEDYADWLKRDPIVFTEHGTASAIIAQFGEFPIEKEVVDAAIASNDLIGEVPSVSDMAQPSDADLVYREAYRRMMLQQAVLGQQQYLPGTIYSGPHPLLGTGVITTSNTTAGAVFSSTSAIPSGIIGWDGR